MSRALAKIYAAELEGIRARLVEVEVDMNVGLHSFTIVGLADKAVNEAKERVNAALKNVGVKAPSRENRRITVNLAPADVKKAGSQYDLAIALGYLRATGQLREFDPRHKLFLGELALDGRLRPVNGTLNIAEMAAKHGFDTLYLPRENAAEAAVINGLTVIPLDSLEQAIEVLEERIFIEPGKEEPPPAVIFSGPDLAEVRGQASAKRALMIAAAGGHNLLMIGPPGVGKSLLAQALVGILPRLTKDEAIDITKIWSAAGLGEGGMIRERPFRAPHHTASLVSIVGGGTNPKPGEISLAHRGVLFLDELPEYPKNILESLRQPLESGAVHVARAKGSLTFPARFTLIAAMNPCPCGYAGDPEKPCQCSPYEVVRYQKKISGPLLDRIDLQIRVPRVALEELRRPTPAERESERARRTIEAARERQAKRFSDRHFTTNAEMSSREATAAAALDTEGERFLSSLERAHLSPRSYYRLLKTARTIADLDGESRVSAANLAEAFSYRLREEA